MSRVTVKQRFLEKHAAESEYTVEELEETAKNLHSAIFQNLADHFESSRLRTGDDYWVMNLGRDGVYLAFTRFELAEQLRNHNFDVDSGKINAVALAYLEAFQDWGHTLTVSNTMADRMKDPLFIPFYVSYPSEWQESEWHTFQRFTELVSRYEMSPAEVLDYWTVERLKQTPREWAGKRNVGAEAVRKNVRQAKKKLSDKNLGATHERSQIRVAPVEEIPEDLFDEETERYYMPDEAATEAFEDNRLE